VLATTKRGPALGQRLLEPDMLMIYMLYVVSCRGTEYGILAITQAKYGCQFPFYFHFPLP